LATKLATRKKICWDAITDDYLLIMSGNNAGSGENGIKKFDVGPNAGTSPAALSRLVKAWHYKAYQREQSPDDRLAYAAAEKDAAAAHIGLWQDAVPVAPWEWRHPVKAAP
jgi:hypothetical protein